MMKKIIPAVMAVFLASGAFFITPQTVKIDEEFTLRPHGSASLADGDLTVRLLGWTICPKGAMCIVQDHVNWSVKTNSGKTSSHPSFDSMELPPYKVLLLGTDWKQKATFKITSFSLPDPPKADKTVKLNEPFSLSKDEVAALEEDPHLVVRLVSLFKCDKDHPRQCETPSHVRFRGDYMGNKVENGPYHFTGHIGYRKNSYAVTVKDSDYETTATLIITQ